MPIVYTLNGNFGGPVNISAFVAAAQAAVAAGHAAGGALPRMPITALGTTVYNLGVHGTQAAPIGLVDERTLAFGLITCAAVIYASTDPAAAAAAWVHHANAGHVGAGDVAAARAALNNPPWASILAVFAHP